VTSYSHQRADVEELLRKSAEFELTAQARVRLECVLHYFTHGENATVTSRRFGISRATFYNWLKKVDLHDPSSLENRSKAPKRVPQPETDERTIALIGEYRRRETLLCKEEISGRLLAEHGIAISASTVGRVISRNGFYFADTPLHAKRRRAVESKAQDDVVAGARGEIARRVRSVVHIEKRDDGGDRGWQATAMITLAATGASFLVDAKPAHALEGSSYRLLPTFPNQTATDSLEGASFTVSDGAITGARQPLQGSVYQIRTHVPSSAAASSASSSQQLSVQSSTPPSNGAADDSNAGGGRRTIPPSWFSSPRPSSASSSPASAKPASSASSDSSASPRPAAAENATEPSPFDDQAVASLPDQPGAPAEQIECPVDEWRSTVPAHQGARRQSSAVSRPVRGQPEIIQPHQGAPRVVDAFMPTAWVLIALSAAFFAGFLAWRAWRLWMAAPRRAKRGKEAARRRSSVRWKRHAYAFARSMARSVFFCLLGVALLLAILWGIARANAATTVPQNHWYQGHLLNSSGNPVTTAVTIRLSYWKSADFASSDLTGTGAINTAASNYVSWYEEHTITPSGDGSFAVELGSVRALPDMSSLPASTLTSLYLQVEVKASGAADSTYDLLDADTGSISIDRTSVLSLPFARNADLLDQRDAGTGSGSIPILSSGGSLGLTGNLTINVEGAAQDAVLTFGNDLLDETFKFSAANGRFELSDDLRIDGDLGVTGTASGAHLHFGRLLTGSGTVKIQTLTNATSAFQIFNASGGNPVFSVDTANNRVGIGIGLPETALEILGTASGTHLHASSGLTSSGALAVEGDAVIGGTLKLNGVTYAFPASDGTSGAALQTNGNGQLSWGAIGTGALATRARTLPITINTAAITKDGTNNQVNVYVGSQTGSTANPHQYHRVSSGSGQLQDIDIRLKVLLPSDFVSFANGGDLNFSYRNTGASAAASKLDILVEDDDGDDAFAASDGQGLFSASWSQYADEFDGASFNPAAGEYVYITIKAYASSGGEAFAGEVILTYTSR
jgi:transposase